PDDRVELGGDRVGAVAGVDEHDDAELVAHPHDGAQPVQGPVGPVGVHVCVQLQHLVAVLADVELQLGRPVLRAEAGLYMHFSTNRSGYFWSSDVTEAWEARIDSSAVLS